MSCRDSSLKIEQNEGLILKNNSRSYTVAKKILNLETLSLVDMSVERVELLSVFNQKIFYEQINTENDHELRGTSLNQILRIFNLKSANVVYQSNSLLFVQLEEKNSYINLIAETSSLTTLSFVYGFSNREFFQIADVFEIKADSLKLKGIERTKEIKTQYNRQEFILNPIIDSNPGWGV